LGFVTLLPAPLMRTVGGELALIEGPML